MVISPLFVATFGAPDLLDNYTLTQVLGLRYSFIGDVDTRNSSILKLSIEIPYCTVEVPNSDSISCSNSSLLEFSPVTQMARVRLPPETCLYKDALVEDGDDLGPSYRNYQRRKSI